MAIFTRMTGQDFNLGDTALRRAMLAQTRTDAPLHVLVGDHSADYVEALGLREEDAVYTDYGEHQRALREYLSAGPVAILEKPGAFQAAHRFGRHWPRSALLAVRVRAQGGAVLWLGAGVQHRPTAAQKAMMRVNAAISDEVAWRDTGSADWFGSGRTMPDWAFALPSSGQSSGGRSRLALSIRGDRPAPPDAWLDAVGAWCADEALSPIAVAQVRIDNDHARRAAKRLDCEAITWSEESHLAQEQTVRDIYADCALVLSDRLHVLILAMSEGAIPACLLPVAEDKIDRHLAVTGFSDAASDVTGWSETQLGRALDHMMARREEARACYAAAKARVEAVGRETRMLLGARLAPSG